MKYKPIDIGYVVELINKILGDNFFVESNSVLLIKDDKTTKCSLQTTREPFPMDNIASETIQLTLYAYMNVHSPTKKSYNESCLSQILGARQGKIIVDDQEYSFNLYFKDCHPASDPQYDMGIRYCTYVANGSILITLVNGGGLLSNDITFELADKPFDDKNCVSSELAVLNVEESPNFQNESMINLSSCKVTTSAQANAYTVGIIGITLYDNLHDKLLKAIDADKSTEFYLKKKIGSTETIKHMRLIEGKTNIVSGSYMQYQISLQEV